MVSTMTLSFAVAERHHLDAPADEDFEALVQHPYVQAAVAIRTINDIHGSESEDVYCLVLWTGRTAKPHDRSQRPLADLWLIYDKNTVRWHWLEVHRCARTDSRRVAGGRDVNELVVQLPPIRIEAPARPSGSWPRSGAAACIAS